MPAAECGKAEHTLPLPSADKRSGAPGCWAGPSVAGRGPPTPSEGQPYPPGGQRGPRVGRAPEPEVGVGVPRCVKQPPYPMTTPGFESWLRAPNLPPSLPESSPWGSRRPRFAWLLGPGKCLNSEHSEHRVRTRWPWRNPRWPRQIPPEPEVRSAVSEGLFLPQLPSGNPVGTSPQHVA